MSHPPEYYAKSGTEDGHQTALFVWAQQHRALHPELEWLFAIPNGGQRNPVTAARMKATGTKSGVPDIMLPVPCRNYAGLFIEMKKPSFGDKKAGVLSSDQKDRWIPFLTSQHYCVTVCYGWEQARDALLWYLSQERGSI